ncbi:unnamed protein product, partial [Mesorhabditis spiculigera]
MAALGFMDVFSLCLSAHLSGIFYILGAEYSCVATVCQLSNLLVINRILDIWRPQLGKFLFEGARTWFYIVLILIYGLMFVWKAPPAASWHLMHGIPSLVYLFLNKTIHRRVFGKYSVFHYRASSGIKPLSTVQKESPSKGHSQAGGPMSEVRLGF